MNRHSRRQFVRRTVALAGLGLLTGCSLPFIPSAQRARLYRVGCLLPQAPTQVASTLGAFRQGLGEQGYSEGENIALEVRYAEGRPERLPELAGELASLEVHVILTGSNDAIRAARQATATIPIVFAVAGDPVAEGFVASLARPGGNATGLTQSAGEESAKRLELLKEAVPGMSRVGVLWNQSTAVSFRDTEVAARALGVEVLTLELRGPDDLDTVLAAATAGHADGLIGVGAALVATLAPQIVDFAARYRLPGMYAHTVTFPQRGGLMAYGPDLFDNYRRAATYVDKILKGANPADIPVERPSKFDFVINLRTAQSLGLIMPQSVLAQATEIIQ